MACNALFALVAFQGIDILHTGAYHEAGQSYAREQRIYILFSYLVMALGMLSGRSVFSEGGISYAFEK
jgi:hypothetical protein